MWFASAQRTVKSILQRSTERMRSFYICICTWSKVVGVCKWHWSCADEKWLLLWKLLAVVSRRILTTERTTWKHASLPADLALCSNTTTTTCWRITCFIIISWRKLSMLRQCLIKRQYQCFIYGDLLDRVGFAVAALILIVVKNSIS